METDHGKVIRAALAQVGINDHLMVERALASLALLELRESDRQSSESRGLEASKARCADVIRAYVEESHLSRFDRKFGEERVEITKRSVFDALDALVRLASATKPEASPSPESESENV